ncbi:MAG TPA: SCO family protein [Gemmatimonadales bacterium]|nr:SCO family protein [Gemmatimonadales bacterium]
MRFHAVVVLLACSACTPGQPPVRPEDLRGPRLVNAKPLPTLTLQRGPGRRFDLAAESKHKLTFLFFGYTNCPDVCPLHMANLAAALRTLPPETRRDIQVVFVTTDPARDTPERLAAWLAQFDSTFVGVSGDAAALEDAQRALGMPMASRDSEVPDSGGYTISHGAHLWAFTPDDSAHVVYPMGIQRDDLAADIPKLLHLWPGH